jgi:Papain family cysteine protease/Ricin-type beta-trefoil lectin domain-like
MKKTILALILVSSILQPGFAQKGVKTPSKEVVFKTPAYWKGLQEKKFYSAPENVKKQLNEQNQQFEKSGKSLRLAYSNLFNASLPALTGFSYDGKRNVLMDARPMDGPAQPNCLTITATANDRKVDMRDYGIITPVRSQDSCGGCWAFASIAAMETATLLKNGGDASALHLSVTQILACCGTVPGRCGGGMQADAIGYMKDHNIANEAEFPFSWPASDRVACNNSLMGSYRASAGGFVSGSIFLPSPSIAQIKQAIIRYGSVASCIHATDNFKRYGSGVYDLNDNPTVFPNHVIQIIGWDDDLQAWLIKNSWNTDWGIGGFGWVRYNTNVIGAYSVWIEAAPTTNNPCVTVTNNPNVVSNPGNPNATYEELLARFPFPRFSRMQSVQSNLTVDVHDPVFDDGQKGRRVQQWSSHAQIPLGSDGHNQEWIFLPCGKVNEKPIYRLLNYGFTKYLTDNGGTALTENANSLGNQTWFIENSPTTGVYYIKNAYSQKYLQVPAGNNAEGSIITLGNFTGGNNQKFSISSIGTEAYLGDKENTEIYILPSHATHMALDLPGGNYTDNTQLQIWQRMDGNKNQAFRITWNWTVQAYSIASLQRPGNKNLEIYGFSRDNGGRAVIWENVEGENQFWYIIPVVREGGRFLIINKLSGKSLDVSGVGTANGTPIVQWDYVNGGNQKWEFRRF